MISIFLFNILTFRPQICSPSYSCSGSCLH